jgi:catechol 2,3-dioxygenase-like lactoylglutathione lyase family enzyme
MDRSATFWSGIGMREVHRSENVVVLELRGGTHLILFPGEPDAEPGDAPFDLMVDDLDATHAAWAEQGRQPSAIERGEIHDGFTVRDPDGYVVTVSNSHVEGIV